MIERQVKLIESISCDRCKRKFAKEVIYKECKRGLIISKSIIEVDGVSYIKAETNITDGTHFDFVNIMHKENGKKKIFMVCNDCFIDIMTYKIDEGGENE